MNQFSKKINIVRNEDDWLSDFENLKLNLGVYSWSYAVLLLENNNCIGVNQFAGSIRCNFFNLKGLKLP